MSRHKETKIQPNGEPRTKGIRNPIVEAMREVNASGGPMRDRRERRTKDAGRSWRKDWDNT